MNYREAWANGEIEAGTLVDRIEDQAREIERLNREAKNDAIAYKAVIERQNELRAELAALKAQPSTDALSVVRTFITECAECRGKVVEGNYLAATARRVLDALDYTARLNQPASGGDERAAFEGWAKKHNLSLSEDEIDQPDDINLDKQAGVYIWANAESAWLAWQARAALPVRDHVEDARHMVPSVKQIAEALNDVRCFHELSAELIAPMLRENLMAAIFETSSHAGDV